MVFNALASIVLGYSCVCFVLALMMMWFEYRYGVVNGKRVMFSYLNQFSGKQVVTFIRWFGRVAIFAWLVLALSLLDLVMDLHWLDFYSDTNSVLHSNFATLTKQQDNLYLVVVLLLSIGVRGFWLTEMISSSLQDGYLEVKRSGFWNSSKSVNR